MARLAHAPPNGHQPLPLRTAMHSGKFISHWVVDAGPWHLQKLWGICPSYSIREEGQIPDNKRTLFVEDTDRHERDTRAQVLESQVEAFLGQRTQIPNFRVQLQDSVSEIKLCEALVSRDSVDLRVLAFPNISPILVAGFVIVDVESLLARAQTSRETVAVP